MRDIQNTGKVWKRMGLDVELEIYRKAQGKARPRRMTKTERNMAKA